MSGYTLLVATHTAVWESLEAALSWWSQSGVLEDRCIYLFPNSVLAIPQLFSINYKPVLELSGC